MEGNNVLNLEKIGELFKKTVGLMKNSIKGLTERNSSIQNLLNISENMQSKSDYRSLLSGDMGFNKEKIMKWAVLVILIYIIVSVFSYIFINYILFYVIIFVIFAIVVKGFLHYYNNYDEDDDIQLMQSNYYNIDTQSV
ncbi:conserved protein, unknown function [Hepatocystis sp. ex Piliocolobus tephrosceles]|nr:conserved protein, unknown function [Hepatocystis sp. ex Piliocolobus tephrosceles]